MTFAELQGACAMFSLGERATLAEIKVRHRELAKRFHPDRGDGCDQEAMRKVNAAYRALLDYVASYRFSFDEEEFYEQNPEEHLRRQFMDDHCGKGIIKYDRIMCKITK